LHCGNEGHLDKSEALAVLHEIYDSCKESVTIQGMSLDYRSSQISKDLNYGGYLIKMKTELDNYAKKCIMPIIAKHHLSMKEEQGFVVIFKMHSQN
jgi:hypothetical protein